MAPRQYLGVYFSEANPFKSHNLPEDYLTNFPDIHPGLQSFSKHIKYWASHKTWTLMSHPTLTHKEGATNTANSSILHLT